MAKLLTYTPKGLYCEVGNFYIDPSKAVEHALISHAHSDHATRGHGSYLTHKYTAPILNLRLSKNLNIQTVDFGEQVDVNGVKVSFHPSAHTIGSAQIRLEHHGEVWVVSGDYKTENDGISGEFEPVKCDYFITESTFGLPIYKWQPQSEVFAELHEWWLHNQSIGYSSIIGCYSFGKAQRLLHNIDQSYGPVYADDNIIRTNEALASVGVELPEVRNFQDYDPETDDPLPLVLTSNSSYQNPELKRFTKFKLAYASGWTANDNNSYYRRFDRGFPLSDHADWEGLNDTIKATNAHTVYVTHGYTKELATYLTRQGLKAYDLHELI